ncbi:MAG: hypothetical protein AB8E82_04260 [Aureispira sp.]
MNFSFLAFWILMGMLCCTACELPDCRVDYEFDFPLEVSVQDSVEVGDTIWYSMDIREPLLNNNTGDVVNLEPFDLYFKFRVGRLDTLYANYDDKYFTTVVETGQVEQLNNPEFGTFWRFEASNNKQFKIGLVALQSGLYRSELVLPFQYSLLEDPLVIQRTGNRLMVSQTRCEQYITANSRIIANNGNNNYAYIDNLCQFYSPVDTNQLCWEDDNPAAALRTGYFAFVVR